MASEQLPNWRLVSFNETEVEKLPGKTHYWHCKPGMVRDTNLMFVRAQLPPGEAHKFHFHPKMEEILYVLSGTAEQAPVHNRSSHSPDLPGAAPRRADTCISAGLRCSARWGKEMGKQK